MMKRTTYIFIGLLVSGLVVIVATIVFIAMSGKPYPEGITLGGDEQVTMNLNGVHVVKVLVSQDGASKKRTVVIDGEMKIRPVAASSGKEQISYPKGKYLNVIQKNDTLFVRLDFSLINIPDKLPNRGLIYSIDFDAELAVDSLAGIISDANGLKLNLKGFETDSLFVRGHYKVLFDSCQIHSLDIQGYGSGFHARNSKIENFYLNLDGVRRWTFEHTEVGTEYLSGSYYHSNDLQKGECKQVVWTPLTKDACLQVKIREKTKIAITPE